MRMDDDKKLMFINNMTQHALKHAATTPNVMSPDGKMSHDKMVGFIAQMTKHGLQHFADGGTALGGPTQAGSNAGQQTTSGGISGFLGDILGTSNKFKASGTDIQQGTNAAQLNQSYNGAQDALKQQQGAVGQQQALTSTLAGQAQQGAGTQNNLTSMLTARANGQGPNPAQAQLNQNTGQNIAQQAALAAGQRGGGANAGLIARQNAQQGAATQQNAVGQAATLNANQQIAAQNQLQGLAASQVGQGQAGVGALNSAVQGYGQAQQNEQGILQNANTAANNANVAMQSNINSVNSGVSGANQSTGVNVLGGIAGAVSGLSSLNAAAGAVPKAHGGMITKYADGGWTNNVSTSGPQVDNSMPGPAPKQTDLGKVGQQVNQGLKAKFGTSKESDSPKTDANFKAPEVGAQFASNGPSLGVSQSGDAAGPGLGLDTSLPHPAVANYFGSDAPMMAQGGEVPAMVSAKERFLNPHEVKKVLAGADPMKLGKEFHGKAKVKDDSLKNDTIKTTLQEGGVVIPRHITTHKMASEKASEFVRRAAAKKGKLG